MPYHEKAHRSGRKKVNSRQRAPKLLKQERAIKRSELVSFVTAELEEIGAIPTDFSQAEYLSPESAYRKDLLT